MQLVIEYFNLVRKLILTYVQSKEVFKAHITELRQKGIESEPAENMGDIYEVP